MIAPLIPGALNEELYRLLEAKTGVENELINAAGDERAMQQALMARLGAGG